MSEPRGLPDYLGDIIRIAQEAGRTWDEAKERLKKEDDSNVIWVDFGNRSTAVH
jgi:hypothetical protein